MQTPSPTETLRGHLGIYIEDRFERHFTATHYSLQTSTGNIELIFPSVRDAEGLTPGSDIEVTGHRQGSRFVVADEATPRANAVASRPGLRVLRRTTASPQGPVIGQRKIAIILINNLDQTSEPITPAQAATVLQTTNQYYQEASYGQYSIVGDVYGYLNLPINFSCTLLGDTSTASGSFATITSAGIQAAKNAGIDLSSYHSYVFSSATTPQCQWGMATIGGSPGLILDRFQSITEYGQSDVLMHELGHNLGLYHSHSYACNTAIYDPNVDCGLIEYGDLNDIMGAAPGAFYSPHFNASYKSLLGWLAPQKRRWKRCLQYYPV